MEPIPWKDNQHADAMACVASLISLEDPVVDLKIFIQNLSSPAIVDNPIEVAYFYTIDSHELYSHISIYLIDGTFQILQVKMLQLGFTG